MYKTVKIAVMLLVLVGLFVNNVSGQILPFPYRIWTSSGGDFTVEAKLIRMEGKTTVILERRDDQRRIKVQLDRLSKPNQEFISGLTSWHPLFMEEPACAQPVMRLMETNDMPVGFASVMPDGKMVVCGVISEYDSLVKQVDDPDPDLVRMDFVDNTDYIGMGYALILPKEDVFIYDMKGEEVSIEAATERLLAGTPVLRAGYLGTENETGTIAPETLYVGFPDTLDISSPFITLVDKGVMPPPPRWQWVEITDGKLPEGIKEMTYKVCKMVPETRVQTYTVCKMVPETRVKEVSYNVVRLVPETRVRDIHYEINGETGVKQVQYTVMKPVYETCVKQIPYTVLKPVYETRERQYTVMKPVWETCVKQIDFSQFQFDRDISGIEMLSGMFPVASDEKPIDPVYLSLFKDDVPVITGYKTDGDGE